MSGRKRVKQNPLPANVHPGFFNPPGSDWTEDEDRARKAAYEVLTDVEKQEGVAQVAFLVQTQLHVWYPRTWKRNVGGVKLKLEETARKLELHRIQIHRSEGIRKTPVYVSATQQQRTNVQLRIKIMELKETIRENKKEADDRTTERVSGSIASV